MPLIPKCVTLASLLEQQGMTPDELTKEVSSRYQRSTIRSGGEMPFDGSVIEGAIAGEILLPDTLRAQITKTLEGGAKTVFPEYAIACARLREERVKRGWTQAQVATLCQNKGSSFRDTEISALERGNKFAHTKARALLAEVFGLPEPELFPEFHE